MVPSSGDLHIIRADFSDTVENYACRVRNTLNNREEISPAFNLVINGEMGVSLFYQLSDILTLSLKFPRLRTSHETDPAEPTRPVLLLPEGRAGRADLQRAEHPSARIQVMRWRMFYVLSREIFTKTVSNFQLVSCSR